MSPRKPKAPQPGERDDPPEEIPVPRVGTPGIRLTEEPPPRPPSPEPPPAQMPEGP